MERATAVWASIGVVLLCVGASAEQPEASGDGSPWELPAPDSCKPQEGLRGWPLGEDAPPIPFATGVTRSWWVVA